MWMVAARGRRTRLGGFAAASIAVCFGCGGGDDPPGRDASSADRPVVDAAPPTVRVTGLLRDLTESEALAGVEVRAAGLPELDPTATDENGEYEIDVPASRDLVLEFEKEPYLPAATRVLELGEDDYSVGGGTGLFMVRESTTQIMVAAIGAELDPDGAIVVLTAYNEDRSPLAGVRVGIEPESGPPTLYLNDQGFPDPGLEETAGNGSAILYNLDPGSATLTFAHDEFDRCWGFGDDEADPVRVELIAGAMVLAGVIVCTP